MIAVIPVRDGVLPAGADETIAECGGSVVIAGSATDTVELLGLALDAVLVELGHVEFGRWAATLAAAVPELAAAGAIVCPHSPDGRDLAPRLAAALDRPLYAGATIVDDASVTVARGGGRELHEFRLDAPFVATFQPGIRGAEPFEEPPTVRTIEIPAASTTGHSAATTPAATPVATPADTPRDAVVVEVLPPDVRTMDLAEAQRIVGGGAGLDATERFVQLDAFAVAIGASLGATRVITDRGWVHHDKQIGTTGVVVDPELYLAFGISGAVQHTAGLGTPDHIVSVNTDRHCPMMAMADLAIVSDANATLDELARLFDAAAGAADG